jgi:hypothetical protein
MGKFVASAAIALVASALAAGSAGASEVYVTNRNDGTVSQYAVGADGGLSPLSPAAVTASPSPEGIAVSPDGKSVYVAMGSGVAQFDVGPGGGLVPKSPATVPAGSPSGIAVSPDGKSVYAASGGAISQFDLGAGGTLTPKSPATVPAVGHYLAVSPDGTSVYLTSVSGFPIHCRARRSPGAQVTGNGSDRGRSLWHRYQPGWKERLRRRLRKRSLRVRRRPGGAAHSQGASGGRCRRRRVRDRDQPRRRQRLCRQRQRRIYLPVRCRPGRDPGAEVAAHGPRR